MTHWPETDPHFRCLFLVLESMTNIAGKWYRQKKRWIPILQKFVFSYCSTSWKILSSLHFIFYFFYKQISSAIVCSGWPITVQLSSWFPAWNWTCSNWHQFLAPETGALNWPVCHHYKFWDVERTSRETEMLPYPPAECSRHGNHSSSITSAYYHIDTGLSAVSK